MSETKQYPPAMAKEAALDRIDMGLAEYNDHRLQRAVRASKRLWKFAAVGISVLIGFGLATWASTWPIFAKTGGM